MPIHYIIRYCISSFEKQNYYISNFAQRYSSFTYYLNRAPKGTVPSIYELKVLKKNRI